MPAMTVSQRMAAILRLLYENRQWNATPSRDLWNAISDYDSGGESGRRLYRLDISALVARGLIVSGVTTDSTPARTGVRLRFVAKPADLELSAGEHAALRAARARYSAAPPMVPTTDGRTRRGTRLDLAMDALRILDEERQEMALPDLADELREPALEVLAALRELDDVPIEAVSHFWLLLIDDWDDKTGKALPLEQIRVLAERPEAWDTDVLREAGLGSVGRFAYTASETVDRLELIELALADPELGSERVELLCARCKLEQWSRHLAAHGPSGAAR